MRPPYRHLGDRDRDLDGKFRPRDDRIVCGRKFCTACGRWRLLVDFGRSGRVYRARCWSCHRRARRDRYRHRTRAQIEARREYRRWYQNGWRREQGIQPRNFRNPRPRPDPTAKKRMPAQPLAAAINGYLQANGWTAESARAHEVEVAMDVLAQSAGVSDRMVHRVLHEQKWVTLDAADRLALAIGTPLALIYPEG